MALLTGPGGRVERVPAAAQHSHHQGVPGPHQVQDCPLHPQPQRGGWTPPIVRSIEEGFVRIYSIPCRASYFVPQDNCEE